MGEKHVFSPANRLVMKKLLLFLLSLLSLFSCNKEEETNDLRGVGYVLHSRECKYVWAYNEQKIVKNIEGTNHQRIERRYVYNGESVQAQNYYLVFTTCNVDLDCCDMGDGHNLKELYESGQEEVISWHFYMDLYRSSNSFEDEHDKVIETKLLDYFNKKATRSALYASWVHIDYRTTPIKDLKITASQDISGIKAGESLNSLFLLDGYDDSHDFIITADKNLITDAEKIKGIGIDQYLYYHPMAPAALYMKLRKNVKLSAPVETTFTLEITTGDGNVLKSVTPLIKLMPNEE